MIATHILSHEGPFFLPLLDRNKQPGPERKSLVNAVTFLSAPLVSLPPKRSRWIEKLTTDIHRQHLHCK